MSVDSGNDLSSIERKINQASLRIRNIKIKNASAQNQIIKNRDKASRIILQKQAMALSLIQQEKKNQEMKKANQEMINFLRQKNGQKRQNQKRQLRNILTAMYLVKVDDANQLRRISKDHQQKMRQMSQSSLETNRKLKENTKSLEGKAKEAYWREKLKRLHKQNQEEKRQKSQILESKNNYLQLLLAKSNSLEQDFQNVAQQASKQKRKYLSALSLPVRKIASLIQDQCPEIFESPQFRSNFRKNEVINQEFSRINSEPHMEFSSTGVKASQTKLKIVLEALKRKQRRQ